VSKDAKKRIDKAIHFGLGVKDADTYAKEKAEKMAKLKAELAELEGHSTPIIEQPIKIQSKQVTKTQIDENDDEYFAPEDCYEV